MLEMKPWPTGSMPSAITIGIVAVACLVARITGTAPAATITSILSRTSSAAISGSLATFPLGPPLLDENRFALNPTKVTKAFAKCPT
jgi:hypothetical protein